MELIQGGELAEFLEDQAYFSDDIIKFYAVQIIDSVRYLHKHGIAHRDLKLENILIDAKGYLKIIDFGVSKKFENNQLNTNTICGSMG